MLTISGELEPESPDRSGSEVRVRISVPEEFVGAAQEELVLRDGIITDMKTQGRSCVIYGRLPLRGYRVLVEAITRFTQGTGSVEQDL